MTSFIGATSLSIRVGDIVFVMEDQSDCLEILVRTKKLLKVRNLSTGRAVWISKLRFDFKNYYFLEK